MNVLIQILTVCVPILVALIGILPAISSNRKKTQKSIEESNAQREKQITKIQTTLEAHIREDEDDKARNQRYRILRFFDEMCEHRKHSESHFEDILDDIDCYEKYCDSHPEFRNGRGRMAMDRIKTAYVDIKAKGGFLTHES